VIELRNTRAFRTAFAELPEKIRSQAHRAYRLFRENPRHPILRFKQVEQVENVYVVENFIGNARK